jgi:anion-transporting  ArsA/GET3 family ATPase
VKSQKPWLKEIEKLFGELQMHHVPLFAEEVRGAGPLEKIGKQIWKQKK